jgi:hypothetical protein
MRIVLCLVLAAGSLLLSACASLEIAVRPRLSGKLGSDPNFGKLGSDPNFELLKREPAWGGQPFGDVGQYEVVSGIAHLRIDPDHPLNRGIVDLTKPVQYKVNIVVARPLDPARASGVLLVDIPNRGNKLLLRMLNEGRGNVLSPQSAGTAFAMRRGHTLAWIGWQGDIPLAADGQSVGAEFPLVDKRVTGPSMEEVVFDDARPDGAIRLSYPAASLDPLQAELTVRARPEDAPVQVQGWRYGSERLVEFARPSGFDAGAIYRFRYIARDPKIMGLGLAALRDAGAFLKDGGGPMEGRRPRLALVAGVSQSGRVLRDFIWQGFNQRLDGGKVYDGAMPLIAGARKSFTNYRFAQPGRNSTQHIDHWTPGDQFPFSYAVTRDPVTGQTDGIFARCSATATCPKLMHVDSSVEFWQGRASLIVTDGADRDIPMPPDVRTYLMSSTQHVYADLQGTSAPPPVGICTHPANPARQGPAVRMLLDRLIDWAGEGKPPPDSRFPTLASARLTMPVQDLTGFPRIGVTFPYGLNTLDVTDYSTVPPRVSGGSYKLLVPMTDEDGHDLAGIRLPDIAVPLATHTGWNLRSGIFAAGQLCDLTGSYFPLPSNKRPGDPRRSLAERYKDRLDYAKAVAAYARAMRDEGLLLDEDVERFIERAKADARITP